MTRLNFYIAEFLGTLILVFIGCGAIVVNETYGGVLGHGGISAAFGLVVMAIIYAIGNISGAHINPAVTLAFAVAGRLPPRQIIFYWSSQFAGAIVAALLLAFLFPEHTSLGSTIPPSDVYRVFVMELMLSFILMWVILNVSTGHQEKGIMAGAAIGATVAMEALMGGPVSGASMNPARSLGPAWVSGELQGIWIYIVAPMLGMCLAAPLCRYVQGEQCCTPQSEKC